MLVLRSLIPITVWAFKNFSSQIDFFLTECLESRGGGSHDLMNKLQGALFRHGRITLEESAWQSLMVQKHCNKKVGVTDIRPG